MTQTALNVFSRSARSVGLMAGWLVFTSGPLAMAQVKLDRLFPAAVASGQATTIKAEGKFPEWPVTIVCDRSDVHVVAGETSGELQVTVDAEAFTGVAWLRLHDAGSVSQLMPLLVEPCPVATEAEPNNKISEAMAISSPSVVSGRLEKSGDIDTYRISARAGQTLVVSITANRILRSPMDAVLQLVDDAGNVMAQMDDDCGLDPLLVFHVPSDGEYLVRVFAFPETPNSTIGYAGDASFLYVLRATSDFGMLDHLLPIVAGGEEPEVIAEGWNLPEKTVARRLPSTSISPVTLSVPQTLGWQWLPVVSTDAISILESADPATEHRAESLPFVFSGAIGQPGEIDRVRFSVSKDSRYRIAVESKRFGFLLDSLLRLVNPEDGSELAKNDDRGRNDYDAAIDYQAKADGEVELQISDTVDGFGPRHVYSVLVEQSEPRLSLEVAADHFLLNAGSELEIPVTITRANGFDQRVEIFVEKLPAGVTAEAVVSEAKGDSAKSVKLKLVAKADASYQGRFRVVADVVDAEGTRTGQPTAATFALREAVRPSDFWLTVTKAK